MMSKLLKGEVLSYIKICDGGLFDDTALYIRICYKSLGHTAYCNNINHYFDEIAVCSL